MNLNEILSVSESLETPFFYEKLKYTKYLDMYKQPKRGSKGLDAWLIAVPYLSLAEQLMLIGPPIKSGLRLWHMPGHVLFKGVFSNKPGLRKVFRKV